MHYFEILSTDLHEEPNKACVYAYTRVRKFSGIVFSCVGCEFEGLRGPEDS